MNADFFERNREKLAEAVKGSPVILTAYTAMQRCSDESWRFEQEANFWYLTGIEAADWQMVLVDGQTTLIAPDISKKSQIFDGSLSTDEARKISGAGRVISRDEGVTYLSELAKKHKQVFTISPGNAIDYEFSLNPARAILAAKLRKNFSKVKDIRPVLHQLRAIKQPAEIMMLRRAINLTRSAFETVKTELSDYKFEYEIQARLSYEFERAGATHAYDPIVAGGENALTLHYNANRAGLRSGNLVLIDAGARYGNYSADITRTYAFGDVSARQKATHAAVKNAKDAIVDLIKPGLAISEYVAKSDEIVCQALKSLDLLQDQVLQEEDFIKYFPHAVSHGLGIETHDPLGNPKTFQTGMVLTVEPGIYIPEEGIGVRLEDDILITDSGSENLSRHLADNL
ncbi:MAG: Xaa-Pro peptidase family protein [Candidatus Nomurabacteria bacterium]|jgi:Xaa-Pro aminopeptidase|nr:Xaa-Pro peptidase family protein [Candidatus Nomurabacteria bacterium]